MRTVLKLVAHLLLLAFLTLFTQIGGVVWLLCLPLFFWLNRRLSNFWLRPPVKIASFSVVYLTITLFLVPPLAKWQCGRVPLPIWSNPHLRPHNAWFYCLFNRHYVKPALRTAAENAARRLAEKYPGAVVSYLDGCFPFIDGYPLQPHFSHRDGEKLDVAFHWLDASAAPIFGTPMRLGYGAFEMPLPGEIDKDEDCPNSRFRNLELQRFGNYDKARFQFDAKRTGDMIRFFAEEKAVGKILLEPHLKARLGLSRYDKIRFQGCKAARHDDHIHVQL